MDKIKRFWKDEKWTYVILLIGICGIFFYYGKKVALINGVWELADEYGYLSNAAYLTKTNWNYMVNLYYGYGYSFLLVPLFLLFDTGIEIIHGAIWVNIICLALLFLVQYVLLSKIFKKVNRKVIVLVSWTLCFYPYLTVSVLKVMPECLLTLMVWVCGLLLYQTLDTGKWYYYMLLAVALVYTFLVHTRALIFCAVIFLVIIVDFLKRKNGTRWLLLFLGASCLLFGLGFLLKNQLIDTAYSNLLSDDSGQTGNLIQLSYVIEKMIDFLTNFQKIHLYSIWCKVFYLTVATVGMYPIGIYAIIKASVIEWKKRRKIGVENTIQIMYGMASLLMVAALIVHSPGNYEKTAYFYYGRYYEYLVGPIAAFGLFYCIRYGVKVWEAITLGILILVSGLGAEKLSWNLQTQAFYYDGNRVSGFSLLLTWFDEYSAVIIAGMIFVGILGLVCVLLSRTKKAPFVIAIILFGIFFLNDKIIVRNTLEVNTTIDDERMVAEFIHESYEVDEVYILKSDEDRIVDYTSMQCLLGKQKLNVIETSGLAELKEGDLLITFYHDPRMEEAEKPYEKLMEAGAYELFLAG